AVHRFGKSPDGLVHLWSLDSASTLSAANVRATLRSGAMSAVLLLQALLELAEGRLWLVTRLAQPVGGAPSEAGILQTPLWGIGKSIALEEPTRWGGLVDLDAEAPELSAEQLAGELVNPIGPEHEDHVAIRGGRRLVARIRPTPAPAGQGLVLAPDATYLVSGGLGA